ncbi:hypothetical protein H2204_009544 [Knufia peltigerae]|uniref:Major facilitator superfamily (MFS) profile domain-containing protein n=1 Tax=Knufia peltigerae TaxID=1002370 RepID=A0AA38XYW4_9EURO|nr:hypothetical protein H2204_009544 [Knufia peltigerae]
MAANLPTTSKEPQGSSRMEARQEIAKPSWAYRRHNQRLGEQTSTHNDFTTIAMSSTPSYQIPPSSSTARVRFTIPETTMSSPRPLRGPPIMTETTLTVEELPADQTPQVSDMALWGDSTPFYQVTVTAASNLARNLVRTSPVFGPTTGSAADGNANNTGTTDTNDGEENVATQAAAESRRWISTGILVAMMNMIAIGIDSMIGVMMPTILYDLDVLGFEWVFSATATGAAACALFAGQIYTIFPFKVAYIAFTTIVLFGTISAGFTRYMGYMYFARLVLGIGIGGQQLGAILFLERGNTFMDKIRRDFYLTLSTSFGMILGPIFGALFVHSRSLYDWAFYTAFILGTLLFVGLAYLLPNKITIVGSAHWTYTHSMAGDRYYRRMDQAGMAFSSGSILILFMTLNWAGTWLLWSDSNVHALMGLGFGLLFLLIVQQYFKILTSSVIQLFPTHYLRSFKKTGLFMAVFLTAGIIQTVLPYTAFYQLVTQPEPSAIPTAFYLFFSMTAAFVIPTLVIHVHLGGGMVEKYSVWPSYSIWTLISSIFILVGSVILFINTPRIFPSGLPPTVARQFALACIGFWSSVVLPIANQIMDVYQPLAGQHHPLHNRVFVLFGFWLGAAVALTASGSIFMQHGTTALLDLLRSPRSEFRDHAGYEDAQVLMLGYTFVRAGTESIFAQSIAELENTFALTFAPVLVFAGLLFVLAVAMVVKKKCDGGLGAVPKEWAVQPDGPQDHELVLRGGGAGASGDGARPQPGEAAVEADDWPLRA